MTISVSTIAGLVDRWIATQQIADNKGGFLLSRDVPYGMQSVLVSDACLRAMLVLSEHKPLAAVLPRSTYQSGDACTPREPEARRLDCCSSSES
jgi:hypothetical protein